MIAAALDRWHYLGALAFCVGVTLPLEFVLGARVYRQPARLALTLAAVAVPFVVVDLIAVDRGLWTYSERYVVGTDLFGILPIEELLFFLVIPCCALLTYSVVDNRGWRRPRSKGARPWRPTQP